jgi:hypothetical protein
VSEQKALSPKQGASVELVRDLVKRAGGGDREAMGELRGRMGNVPGMRDRLLSDFVDFAKKAWFKMIAGENLLLREGLQQQTDDLCAGLLQAGDTPLERLLVDRIVMCWLQVQQADALYAQNAGSLSLQWSEFCQRRLDRTHRRFLSACKTLATVRKLAVPALQVNIGENQVNIAQGAPAASIPA